MSDLQRAIKIIEECTAAALSHPATYKEHHDAFAAVTTTAASITDRMTSTIAGHPDWSCLPELGTKLVLLWHRDPAAYRNLVGAIAKMTDRVALDTLQGMLTLNMILGGLSDDHDYSLDPTADFPRLVMQHELREFAPTIRPIHLLTAITAHYFAASQREDHENQPND